MTVALLVDNDTRTRSLLAARLVDYGYVVREAGTAAEALAATELNDPDVVVIDLGLPDLAGAAVVRALRGISQVPVLVMTRRCDEDSDHVIRLFNFGADDYLVMPLRMDEITLRIHDALRKRMVPPPTTGILTVGELRIDLGQHTAHLGGRDLKLTTLEFRLLAYLANREATVVPKNEIIRDVWHYSHGDVNQTIIGYICRLRTKLCESGTRPRYLHTVRRAGLMVKAP